MKTAALALLLLLLALASACKEPAEITAEHFEAMALIAESRLKECDPDDKVKECDPSLPALLSQEDCDTTAAELSKYLEDNKGSLEEAISEVGASDDVQAQRISIAAQRIDKIVLQCAPNAPMKQYADQLSKLVLKATGLGK